MIYSDTIEFSDTFAIFEAELRFLEGDMQILDIRVDGLPLRKGELMDKITGYLFDNESEIYDIARRDHEIGPVAEGLAQADRDREC